jgi:hypothetical protein
MSNRMTSVVINGTFRKQPMTATYTRNGDLWLLNLQVGDKSHEYWLGKSDKPCWTVALQFADKLFPRPSKAQQRPRPMLAKGELKVVRYGDSTP